MRSSSQLVIDMRTSSFPSTTLPHVLSVSLGKRKGAEKIEFGKSGRLSAGLQGQSQLPGVWRTGRRASSTCTSGESSAVGRLLSEWSRIPEQVLEGKSAWESLCSKLREKMVCGMGTTCTCHENAVLDSE